MPRKKAQPKKTTRKKTTRKKTSRPWLTRDIKPSDLPKVYELLSERFPENAIVKGKLWYGLETEGPRGQSVINRLNEVLGINHWHYEYNIEDEKTGKLWSATCGMKLMIGNWKFIEKIKIATGPPSQNYTKREQSELIFVPLASRSWVGGVSHLSRSEAKKGAITNTLKKCAVGFGVANEIYERLSEPEFEDQDKKSVPKQVEERRTEQKADDKKLKVEKKGDEYSQLLTELNSVQNKETLVKAQDHMDKVKGRLTTEQLSEAVKIFANLKKKYQ